jgi:hypothetical protein
MYQQAGYPQNQMLPFSPEQVQRQYLQGIGPQNPPFVPPVGTIQGHPQILQFVPVISGWAAAEIQNTAESNALRRFFFNMLGQNNFANEDFVALVQGIVDFMELQWANNPGLNPQALLEKSILQSVEMLVANLTRMFPVLNNYLTPQTQQALRNTHAAFDNLKAGIMQLRGVQMQQASYQAPWGVQQSTAGRVDNRWPGSGSGVALTGNQPSLFSNTPPGGAVASSQGPSMAGRWAGRQLISDDSQMAPAIRVSPGNQAQSGTYIAPSAAPTGHQQGQQQEAVSMENQQQAAPTHGPLEPIYSTKLKWVRHVDQPYFPAWNPDQQNIFLQRRADGVVIVQIKDPNKSSMEYDRHKIASVFGAAYRPADPAAIQEKIGKIREGLANIDAERERRAHPDTDPAEDRVVFPTHVNKLFAVDLSEELVWIRTSCNWLESTQSGKRADIYRRYGYVVELSVAAQGENNLIESLRATSTWENLWHAFTKMKPVMTTSLWIRINKRITDLVNRVLTFNLGLDVTIDSFADDITDLFTVLRDDYPEPILRSFKSNQAYLIQSIFEVVPDDDELEYLESLFTTEDDPSAEHDPSKVKPIFTHLIKAASFTFLNCLSHELQVELGPRNGSMLTQRFTPVLYDIAKGIIEETNAISNEPDGTTFANHYIQTLDGKILEIDTGFLGEDTYLIRLVK